MKMSMKQYIFEKTKELVRFIVYSLLPLAGGGWAGVACSDMLETESTRQVFDPELNQKTDSMFYAFGIAQGLQQLADQYVYVGEVRGDLVEVNRTQANKSLQQLADFDRDSENKYDSAYVFYRVINNCNYYIAHRDTMLMTGNDTVSMKEYVAVKAIRAWTYLQLARIYKEVPFYTYPLTSIEDIEHEVNAPKRDLQYIVGQLAPDLEQYTGFNVPYYRDYADVGNPAWRKRGENRRVYLRKMFIPVDVILGEMYLETGDYRNAARHYATYLTHVSDDTRSNYAARISNMEANMLVKDYSSDNRLTSSWGSNIFLALDRSGTYSNPTADLISYIPMATNKRMGTTSTLPAAFGWNFFAETIDSIRSQEVPLLASKAYRTLSDTTTYYYRQKDGAVTLHQTTGAAFGDQRIKEALDYTYDSVRVCKYQSSNITLYRTTTVLLHLAEALNRMGYVDAAFAILKDGLTYDLLTQSNYITDATREMLTGTKSDGTAATGFVLGLLSEANRSKFVNAYTAGIHGHGAGYTDNREDGSNALEQRGIYNPTFKSPYALDTIVNTHVKYICDRFSVSVPTTAADTLQARIDALEDLLCDEYALELAFEGTRFFDLCRLARHKNAQNPYGSASFGSEWLYRKMRDARPSIGVDLRIEDNWYLKFK